jgi:cobalt/nickel transport system permease protein
MSALADRAAPRAGGLIESLDARTRLLGALALVIVIVSLQTFPARIAALALAALLVNASPLPWRDVLRRLAHVEGFMIALLVLLPFTAGGPALAQFGPLSVSARGLERAFAIVLAVNASALVTLALLGALEPVRIGRALAAMRAPQRLVHLLLFLVRYLPTLREELTRQREAMRARAFRPALSRHAWRSFGNLVGMLLVRSIERAERVEEGMRCRAFSGRFPLRAMKPMGGADARFAALAIAGALALLAMDRLP